MAIFLDAEGWKLPIGVLSDACLTKLTGLDGMIVEQCDWTKGQDDILVYHNLTRAMTCSMLRTWTV